jgi:hypothetical protein
MHYRNCPMLEVRRLMLLLRHGRQQWQLIRQWTVANVLLERPWTSCFIWRLVVTFKMGCVLLNIRRLIVILWKGNNLTTTYFTNALLQCCFLQQRNSWRWCRVAWCTASRWWINPHCIIQRGGGVAAIIIICIPSASCHNVGCGDCPGRRHNNSYVRKSCFL